MLVGPASSAAVAASFAVATEAASSADAAASGPSAAWPEWAAAVAAEVPVAAGPSSDLAAFAFAFEAGLASWDRPPLLVAQVAVTAGCPSGYPFGPASFGAAVEPAFGAGLAAAVAASASFCLSLSLLFFKS